MSVQDLMQQIGQKPANLFPLSPKAVRLLRNTEKDSPTPQK